jgi:hypothetical protein
MKPKQKKKEKINTPKKIKYLRCVIKVLDTKRNKLILDKHIENIRYSLFNASVGYCIKLEKIELARLLTHNPIHKENK